MLFYHSLRCVFLISHIKGPVDNAALQNQVRTDFAVGSWKREGGNFDR